jgi:hypothetical protein
MDQQLEGHDEQIKVFWSDFGHLWFDSVRSCELVPGAQQ